MSGIFCLFLFFETEASYVAQAGLKLAFFLPQLPEYWDYRFVTPYQAKTIGTLKISVINKL
jgi:hypothetical protein